MEVTIRLNFALNWMFKIFWGGIPNIYIGILEPNRLKTNVSFFGFKTKIVISSCSNNMVLQHKDMSILPCNPHRGSIQGCGGVNQNHSFRNVAIFPLPPSPRGWSE